MTIKENLQQVEETLNLSLTHAQRQPEAATLIAVTKAVSNEETAEIYHLGIKNLAENRPEGLIAKQDFLPEKDIIWHYIGNLQSRKVKQVINRIDYFHSLDRLTLASEIEKRADHQIACFVQVNVSKEESKHGISPAELTEFIAELANYSKIQVIGLMTMAPLGANEAEIRHYFSELRILQAEIASKKIPYAPCTELSMGMSNDYQLAVEEGATFIRVGSLLFK
ncbi:MAG: YggS family pyridoxal phosphate-dependent enzyme [Carnobacterium sp.]|uniref:Pyridoxal phosphate homeostasis protein n=1 Tax=Carnobacterium maltaromaticum TaxID=2751 RepID=A0AAW9K5Z9_CARML|nr:MULTISPECIES: YggS family pyridoxal phosphate-dependent enzyme [Carnobacterium]KRN84378.1 hypothetical protein IV75_GL000562 [Carnobacterium maltaromaticum]MBC9787108.1 YggS family pyridoxal phosphate-dependent enzyme [Carnobacterium maltaromaticum]MBQ6485032.1 YggS family pyridoxal phosphate-dependent enzyme [Carnobacterium sp.]MCC4311739.1 hypothetical protein [Carnobacterium maltaromaticum]MDT1946161.1 YggS family pyridoxal phosphate-dependent enzyme [Carnobacterium maltaromaticum]